MKVLYSKCILNVQLSLSLVDSSRALELVSMGFEASITWASVLVAIALVRFPLHPSESKSDMTKMSPQVGRLTLARVFAALLYDEASARAWKLKLLMLAVHGQEYDDRGKVVPSTVGAILLMGHGLVLVSTAVDACSAWTREHLDDKHLGRFLEGDNLVVPKESPNPLNGAPH
ncbi:hypothetical protein CFP56_025857 [Quercus suber]|uniref:Uncharacterized protein n=1 Tax=Quercus suber TaxID=58331 RepID=A0AAW0K3H6_QUESU